MRDKIDPITSRSSATTCMSAREEMARNLVPHVVQHRSSTRSTTSASASTTANGDMVADAPGIAVFTRGNDYGIKRSVEFLGAGQHAARRRVPLNYPYWSSRAHPRPAGVRADLHVDGELIGLHRRAKIHCPRPEAKDTGTSSTRTDMFQEGLILPGRRSSTSEGEPNEDIFNIIRFNSRMPEPHDRRHAGRRCRRVVTGVRRVQELCAKFGVEHVQARWRRSTTTASGWPGPRLAELPKGTWTRRGLRRHDGVDLDRLVKIDGDGHGHRREIVVDWTGAPAT